MLLDALFKNVRGVGQDEFMRNVKRFKPHLDPELDLLKVIRGISISAEKSFVQVIAELLNVHPALA